MLWGGDFLTKVSLLLLWSCCLRPTHFVYLNLKKSMFSADCVLYRSRTESRSWRSSSRSTVTTSGCWRPYWGCWTMTLCRWIPSGKSRFVHLLIKPALSSRTREAVFNSCLCLCHPLKPDNSSLCHDLNESILRKELWNVLKSLEFFEWKFNSTIKQYKSYM